MARDTIKQRISLDGGKDIRDELKKLGKEGEAAFDAIRKAALKANFERFRQDLGKFGSDLQRVAQRAAIAFAAIATGAAAAATAIFNIAKHGAKAADEAGKAAQAAGVQVEAYSKLAFAASQSAVSTDELRAGLARLNREIGEAASGSKKSAEKFKELGVSLFSADRKLRPTEEIVAALADAFAAMPDSAQKSAKAIDLFGRSGAQLLPLLNAGSAGLADLGRRAEALGIVFTEQQFRIAEAMNDTLAEVRTAASGITAQIGLLFAPSITAAAEVLRDILIENREAVVRFGRALTIYGLTLLSDFIALLRGDDDTIRNQWLVDLRDGIVGLGQDLKFVYDTILLPFFRAIGEAGQLVADAINAAFGTELTSRQVLIAAFFAKILGLFSLAASSAILLASSIRLVGSAMAFAFGGGILATVARLFTALVGGAAAFIPLIGGLISWPALLVAGLVAAAVAVVVFWDDIRAGAIAAYDAVARFFSAENFDQVVAGLSATGEEIGRALVAGIELAGIAAVELLRAQFAVLQSVVVGVAEAIRERLSTLFTGIGNFAAIGFEAVRQAAQNLVLGVVDVFAGLGSLLAGVWSPIATTATTIFDAVVVSAEFLFTRISAIFAGGVEIVRQAFETIAGIVTSIWSGATDQVRNSANQILEAIAAASDVAGNLEGAAELADALVQPFIDARDQIESLIGSFDQLVDSAFAPIIAGVRAAGSEIKREIESIIRDVQRAIERVRRLRAEARRSGGAGDRGFSGGGHVLGPGTATSDSIPAWLSRGEFVIQAATVRKFGVEFFANLNRGLLPLRGLAGAGLSSVDLQRAFRGLEGFAAGGLVPAMAMPHLSPAAPRFAAGGLVRSTAKATGRPVQINFNTGESFDLVADDTVARKLERYALDRSTRSNGRKPGHIG